MGDDSVGLIHRSSDGGIAGSHPTVPTQPILVGPSTDGQRNKVTTAIIPVACWRVEDLRFEFDSSFVRPEVAEEIGHLAELREDHKKEVRPALGDQPALFLYPPLSIFGHADPVGDDNYNKLLSGRRAQAIYGMLTRNTDLWEELYSHPLGGDRWGAKAMRTMIEKVGHPPGGPIPPTEKDFQKAIQTVQYHKDQRQELFLGYMNAICVRKVEGREEPFKLDREDDFLAGTDRGGKGDYQGCGEFNPVLLFSQKEEVEFLRRDEQKQQNAANGPNRRVMVLLFRPGSRVRADRWPCPRVKEGVGGCHKRFWSDGEKRRSLHLPDERRLYNKSKDTFACRFYDRLSSSSPCEAHARGVVTFIIRQQWDGEPVTNTKFLIQFPDGKQKIETTDGAGQIRLSGFEGQAFTMLRIEDEKRKGVIHEDKKLTLESNHA